MTNKKDFLSSLADELNSGNDNNKDFEIYHATDKKGDELRSYKSQDYGLEDKVQGTSTPKPKVETPKEEVPVQPRKVVTRNTEAKSTSSNKKSPSSFEAEKLQKIEKKPIKIKPQAIIAGVVLLIVIGVATWFLFFAPKIVVPDFVGKNLSEVAAWAKQNEIETAKVNIKEEYNFEFGKDIIISQDKAPNSKVKKDTALTFVKSLGADPNEVLDFPDIKAMNYTELKDWIDTNKLQKTKINTQYNTVVEKDAVISYDLKTGTESSFTRGSTLTINVSKGPAPAGTVTIENYVGKTFAELEQWANTKKVVIEKTEAYSDTIESGKIISQGIKVGESLEEGGKFPVVVSKGKAVKIPNFVGYTKEMLEVWTAKPENKVTIVKKERYNSALAGTVIDQSLAAGSQVDQGTVLELTVSIYIPQLEATSNEWIKKDYLLLHKWVDDANGKGANIQAGAWGSNAKVPTSKEFPTPGMITEYTCMDVNGTELPTGCTRPLPVDARIGYTVTEGKPYSDGLTTVELKVEDMASLESMQKFCLDNNNVACSFKYTGIVGKPTVTIDGNVISSEASPSVNNIKIVSGTTINIEY